MLEERRQNLEWLLLKAQFQAALSQFSRGQINFESAEANNPG
jgi:hypothetical protein